MPPARVVFGKLVVISKDQQSLNPRQTRDFHLYLSRFEGSMVPNHRLHLPRFVCQGAHPLESRSHLGLVLDLSSISTMPQSGHTHFVLLYLKLFLFSMNCPQTLQLRVSRLIVVLVTFFLYDFIRDFAHTRVVDSRSLVIVHFDTSLVIVVVQVVVEQPEGHVVPKSHFNITV